MGKSVSGSPPASNSTEDRLDSWKEIAAYLNRDVTTVQRWEKREAMPVHRHLHDRMGSVYASRTELDTWVRSRKLSPPSPQADLPASAAVPRGRIILLAVGIALALAIAAFWWIRRTDYFWRNPIANARLQAVTDFDGLAEAGSISRDGQFIAFLADRDGQVDVWVTQLGSGQFHNLTRGTLPELANPLLRTPGFSPDGSLVTFWVRKQDASGGTEIGIWAVPTLGGQPRPFLQGVAECDWTPDNSHLVYHTTGPGDPLYVSNTNQPTPSPPIFTARAGMHSHFPSWAPGSSFIYFVLGSLPDQLDIWRIRATGGAPERITTHNARVSHPVLLNRRTLMYLAADPDGSGPWLYAMDVERRIPHRLSFGLNRYTSLAASADGHRLVATLAFPKRTLWRLHLADLKSSGPSPRRISLTTNTGFFPRLGLNYLVYVSSNGTTQSIWKIAGGAGTELWAGEQTQFIGGPAVSPDGRQIAFSVSQQGQARLYVMQSDGTNAHVVADSLRLEGDPAWAPDEKSIMSAAEDSGTPRLFRIPVNGGLPPARFVAEYSIDPAWAPDGSFLVYSGADVGTTFTVKAVTPQAASHPLPNLTLTRGARHVALLSGGRSLVFLRGEIEHKDLWLVDLQTGVERQLSHFGADFDIQDFDISPDGRDVVLERLQDRSDIMLLELPK